MSEQCAVPLCLPNNCKWDAQTGEYSKSAGPRESLCVIEAAIERLKSIKGRVIIHYIISSVIHAFWLVLTYDLLEDRRIDDVIIKTFFNSLLYRTNRFQVAVRLFSKRSQRTSKCGKNISATLGYALCATSLFLPHFDVICGSITEQTHGNLESIC